MARSPKSRKRKKGGLVRRIVVWTLGIGTLIACCGLIALVIAVYTTKASLPSFDQLKSSPNGQMIRVHSADGTVIATLGPSYGQWISYDQIPVDMRHAMISIEDRRFRSHIGVDPIGMLRSLRFAIRYHGTGRRLQGASTITQQVARTIFLSNKYDISRKIREAILALAMERKFSKDQILELYLNKVYFGGGAYGIDAASRLFFGHSATHLSLGEAAIIAGLVKAPSHYSPTADPKAAVDRAGVVLHAMVETGDITQAQADAANPHVVKFAPQPKYNSVRYFTDWALPQLESLIDETQAPLEVWTTLNLKMQREAEAAVRANVPKGAQGALVSMDRDGAVRALVGGTDYVTSTYNRATQAERQPGSSWKLFVYLSALEAGYKPDDMIDDQAVDINGWTPKNDEGYYFGPVTLRKAFALSLNASAAEIGQKVGFGTVADMAKRLGITTPINTYPAMVLGTSNVRLIDMTRAYATISNQGVAVVPFGINRVTSNGQVLYQHETDTSNVLVAPYIAAEMTDLLQTAVNTGTGRAARIGRPVAGKTGTTTSNKDGWFMGFSSGLTTGVWMGRDDAKPIRGLYGGTAPARAFAAFMKQAVADRPVEQFQTALTPPDWQTEPDDQSYFGSPDNGMFVDPNGMPLGNSSSTYPGGSYYSPQDAYPGDQPDGGQQQTQQPVNPSDTPPAPPQRLDQDWLDRALGRKPEAQPTPPAQRRQTQPQPSPSPTPSPKKDAPQSLLPHQFDRPNQ
ncbi:penicillin-binding protein 1A [Stakelama sediminis]|uniref:Penicillin-binding protein 1A n=1 Tax=Stakelama sediminis TaxID=463200 RepID=A0A840YX06_9SPHN|nr:PBP1A family penicillin-binding protein [Stakelama sediminis]MBB5718261.1 penicillin-binding protein 1A [Stakelama sediminis]